MRKREREREDERETERVDMDPGFGPLCVYAVSVEAATVIGSYTQMTAALELLLRRCVN